MGRPERIGQGGVEQGHHILQVLGRVDAELQHQGVHLVEQERREPRVREGRDGLVNRGRRRAYVVEGRDEAGAQHARHAAQVALLVFLRGQGPVRRGRAGVRGSRCIRVAGLQHRQKSGVRRFK